MKFSENSEMKPPFTGENLLYLAFLELGTYLVMMRHENYQDPILII
jgi:hypothetical protein